MVPGSSLRHFLGRVAIALVVVVATTSVGVYAGNAVFEREFERSETVPLTEGVLEPEEKGEPANFLVVGSDSRAFIEDPEDARAFGTGDEVGGERSDTLMVVHVEPESRTGFVVSFPRDLWVQIPGHGSARINKAYGLGGPDLVIQTLTANFAIPIHHYLEVDFDGFRKIVDTIGGVPIYFPTPARDRYSELNVPEAGCHELNGAEALQYTRARHYEWFDAGANRWRQDPRSDLSRIERQQYFMRSLANAAISRGARSPTTAYRLVTEVFDYLKRNEDLGLADLKGLINAFRDLDPASIEMVTLPVDGVQRNGADVVVPRDADAEPILARLRNFGPPSVELPELADPAEISVRVLNGAGQRGVAGDALDGLVAHGFVAAAPAADADRSDHPLTQVRYAPGAVGKGIVVAAYLGTANVVEARPGEADGADVVVVVGRDWANLVGPVKEPPQSAPTGSEAVRGSTTAPTEGATGTTSTTTTRPPSPSATAVVPVDPETGAALVGCP